MTNEVFEYFFDPEDLEPYYAELQKSVGPSSKTAGQRQVNAAVEAHSPIVPKGTTDRSAFGVRAEVEAAPKAGTEAPRTAESPPTVIPLAEPTNKTNTAIEPAAALIPMPVAVTAPAHGNGRSRVRQLLSVHALGQYVFCPRSAILAAERGDEQDADEPLPRLTYLPNFDRARIEEMLKQKLSHLGFSLIYGSSALGLIVAGVLRQNKLMVYPAVLVFIACTMWFLSLSLSILQLAARRRAALLAEAHEPAPEVTEIQAVNWWSMLKAGFEPVNYDRPFRHPELPLEGCPWRVLERGSQRIPVIRSGRAEIGNGKGALYPKHQIRLVAYAMLLEAAGHLDVPYGLVFPSNSTRGLAMPITDQTRTEAVRVLNEFAMKLFESQQHHIEPRLPEHQQRCSDCPHGIPQPIHIAEINRMRKLGNRVVVLVNPKGETFHCDCGDRFGTAPPHGRSIKRGLMASLQ